METPKGYEPIVKKKSKNGKAAAGGKAAKAEASEAKMATAPKPGKAAKAKVRMGKAEAEVKALVEKAPVAVAEAKDAYCYTDNTSAEEEVGNKGGPLSNSLRAVLNA